MSLPPALEEHVSLAAMNSLAVPASARWFAEVTSGQELESLLEVAEQRDLATLILGGGSNLVFAGDFDGLVLHMGITGRCWEHVDGDSAILVLGAGENWHESVLYAASAGYRGIENLALIPGTVGAAPVQNIGAYGVELKDTLVSVTALDRKTGEWVVLANEDCGFGYRDSLFKHQPGRYVITELRLRLCRSRELTLGYADLANYFDGAGTSNLKALDVAQAVMAVRRRKLPDPEQIPNAGSFFKNPIVDRKVWGELKLAYPDMPGYPGNGTAKLAAAWLIDQCGWKGFRNDRVGVHNRQALVLINHSGGSGSDVLALAERIRQDVLARFGVALEMEPGVIPPDRALGR
ncbi:UDP-N-acetylmuramate dehydrogenase [uncultured Marinobacter sp.]|uniref:UDP-N-acetylmuramate dehydrogenase n=1 Tax=uncultured Marinobacter sp. TaxID=187379 RepID=UPI00261BE9FE|nr:UDP-N-acetylmuramate dehydrogenase [uncultured Marinobacter sp.]